MRADKIEIRLYLSHGGAQHGVRYWQAVPRPGDKLRVTVKGQAYHLPVDDVLWGDDPERCIVALILREPRETLMADA